MMINDIKDIIDRKFTFFYNGKKYNALIIILASVFISRAVIYLTNIFHQGQYISMFDSIMQINKWDSGWYRSIVLDGYNEFPTGHAKGDAANWAFFPFYPMLIKSVYSVFKVDPYVIGSIISTIFWSGFLIVGYLYITETRKSIRSAVIFIILMSCGIFSFYFSITYTESTFLFFAISSLYFIQKKEYILAGIFGAIASATRNMGIMLVFAMAVEYTQSYMSKENKSIKGYIKEAFMDYKLIFGVSLIPIGFFSYMTYLWIKVGDPMAFSRIEIAWNKSFSNPIKNVYNALINNNKYDRIMALIALIAIGITIYLFIKKRYTESIMGIIFILIPLSTGMQSIGRYIIGSFVYILGF